MQLVTLEPLQLKGVGCVKQVPQQVLDDGHQVVHVVLPHAAVIIGQEPDARSWLSWWDFLCWLLLEEWIVKAHEPAHVVAHERIATCRMRMPQYVVLILMRVLLSPPINTMDNMLRGVGMTESGGMGCVT